MTNEAWEEVWGVGHGKCGSGNWEEEAILKHHRRLYILHKVVMTGYIDETSTPTLIKTNDTVLEGQPACP
jgi:hypothetical protein